MGKNGIMKSKELNNRNEGEVKGRSFLGNQKNNKQ